MRRHYESLNYMDGDPGSANFKVYRTQGVNTAVIEEMNTLHSAMSRALSQVDVIALRDMLNEVLEDWK